MKNNIKTIGLVILILYTLLIPMVFGNYHKFSEEDECLEKLAIMYNVKMNFLKFNYIKFHLLNDSSDSNKIASEEIISPVDLQSTIISGIPIDSPWPMKCHDNHHTSQSPYSTADNPYDEIWKFSCDWIEDSPSIDNNGIIYFGDLDGYLYALYPDGTLKWKYDIGGWIWSCPAIAEDGTIYVGSDKNYLFAINPDGSEKWKFNAHDTIYSSPAIADNDGTIYFGTMGSGYNIYAVNPNGTEKWHYKTGYRIVSDPAIGDDGTVYIGSLDNYLYAMNPDSTLKWRFKTGDEIHGHPSVADDGTIYIGSYDDYLYAIYSNGTMKWKIKTGHGTSGNPSIANDGIIYVGTNKLYAIYPNGTLKWSFDLGPERHIVQSSPAISYDGTIYIGTNIGDSAGGEILAVNPDGTERFRKKIVKYWVDSSPCIAEDGTIYIGSAYDITSGYLYAFGRAELKADADGPHYGLIDEPVEFSGSATGGYPPYSYHWDFGDAYSSDEQNPSHTYTITGNYNVTLTVTDDTGNTSDDSTWAWIQDGNSPPDTPDIDGPNKGTAGKTYPYTFTTSDPEGLQVLYYIDWDDGSNTGWIGPYTSGMSITQNHKWTNEGTYTIKCKAKDPYDDESSYGELKVTMPRDKVMSSSLFLRFLERFPLIQKLLIRFGLQ